MYKKCVIIRSNALDRDIRIPKEIDILKDKYELYFLGWNRSGISSSKQNTAFGEYFMNIRAPYGKRVILFLPIWWIYVLFWIMSHKLDIVHVINFDSVVPAIFACKLKRVKIIYEILDTYEDSLRLPKSLRDFLIRIDKVIIRFCDAIILADDEQIEEFGGIPNKMIGSIYDSPPDIFLKNLYITKNKNAVFTLFYAGVLYKDRKLNIEKVVDAIESVNGVKVIFAGYGDLEEYIIEKTRTMPNKVEYIGKITYSEVMDKCKSADLLFVLRDPVVPINKYICGSTLLNAMMCSTPIIANKGTSTAKKIYEENCGLVVDADNIEEIKEAIIKLRDNPELCEERGANARKAYEERYSWAIMEQRLVDLYRELTGKIGQEDKEA
jgi:glycosyltransferase involved in cell wall biosynthesis